MISFLNFLSSIRLYRDGDISKDLFLVFRLITVGKLQVDDVQAIDEARIPYGFAAISIADAVEVCVIIIYLCLLIILSIKATIKQQ
tara:strand:+ start:200 stop:457 length:258 start_codon:yes stop_codon:yes gene_type:complete